MPVRYVVLGAGAVGGVIGARLQAEGREVVLIARGEHLERIRERGLLFESPDESRRVEVEAASSVTEVGLSDGDTLILAVKSQDTSDAIETVLATGCSPTIVCAQNGISNEPSASRYFDRVYAAMVWLPSTYLRPGVVQVYSSPIFGVIELGRFPAGVDPVAEGIASDLTAVGFSVPTRSDIMKRKRGKLLVNLANVVHALTQKSDSSSQLVRAARQEAEAVYLRAGLEWTPLAEIAESCRLGMSEVRPIAGRRREGGSTWQSLARGAGSLETDYLNGEIHRIAHENGLEAPINRHLQKMARRALLAGAPPKSLDIEELIPAGTDLFALPP